MSSPQSELLAASAAPVFAALGDTTRLLLLSRLSSGHAQSIVQLTKGTGLTRQGVSKHLAILQKAEVVTRHRVGRESQFAMRADTLAAAGRYIEIASRQWDDAIARLKSLVEE
jgi:DNA-binding transcriptional ArsR family regulator